jgi:hypothetical protein
MATTKTKGDLAELMVAADLRRKGYKLAFPYLRLTPALNGQRIGINFADDYVDLREGSQMALG